MGPGLCAGKLPGVLRIVAWATAFAVSGCVGTAWKHGDCRVVLDLLGPHGGIDCCVVACWDAPGQPTIFGQPRSLCERNECCPNGCAAAELPPGGRCVSGDPAVQCHERALAVAQVIRHWAKCTSWKSCEDIRQVLGARCEKLRRFPCLPDNLELLCPIDSAPVCVQGLCARRGGTNPEQAWEKFIGSIREYGAKG